MASEKRKQLVRKAVGILRALLARFALRGVKSDSRGPLEKVARRLLDECNAEVGQIIYIDA